MRSAVINFLFLRRFASVVTVFILSLGLSTSFGQTVKCVPDDKEAVKYELVQNYVTDLPPYTRSLRVVVKKENFNRAFMVRLANALRMRFCSDEEISAVIFDDKHVAESLNMGDFLTGRVTPPEVRGLYALTSYTLANKGKEESIEFSTKRGNPTNEVVINLLQN
jgi:hypothetical protein